MTLAHKVNIFQDRNGISYLALYDVFICLFELWKGIAAVILTAPCCLLMLIEEEDISELGVCVCV